MTRVGSQRHKKKYIWAHITLIKLSIIFRQNPLVDLLMDGTIAKQGNNGGLTWIFTV
jgi:hypothetical protein